LAQELRRKLVGLLDYVEQVVRLDERVAFRLSEYRLPDGSTFAITKADTENLPGVRHDIRDDEGQAWLEVQRLARKEPPKPPQELGDWIALSPDPARRPELRSHRLVTVTAAQRDEALAKTEVRADDVLEAPRKRGEPENAPPRFDLKLRLEDRSEVAAAIEAWIAGPWTQWSAEEIPRRRTISLYQSLYKIFQLLEVGAAESAVEFIWGIGVVNWQKDGKIIDRPLLERRVEIELDDAHGGLIRIRPTAADALFDLKPYEELGCSGLGSLSDLIRREIRLSADNEGISPFASETFEPILSAAGARLDANGCYAPESGTTTDRNAEQLAVTDKWVVFARPRSQHVVLQDINRLRSAAEDEQTEIAGVAERLLTEPSRVAGAAQWQPLSSVIGATTGEALGGEPEIAFGDVFFPKPFNDDQMEIIRRLASVDGLVVQGPPGTGKTHTIANLICHAMATGQRVLVVSRGESALAVLREQLPSEVQPLAIALLSNERQGLRQVENAIREIQSVTEGARPQSRHAAIVRIEKEIQGLRAQLQSIDRELEDIAQAHLSKIGPRGETPAEVAKRITLERDVYAWFSDRPLRFASETGITDLDVLAATDARRRVGELIDHAGAVLPAPTDLPDADAVAKWHQDLIDAAEHGEEVRLGPARSVHVSHEEARKGLLLAKTLNGMAQVVTAVSTAPWAGSIWGAAVSGQSNPWCEVLRDRIREIDANHAERATLFKRSVDLPKGLLDNEDAKAAIGRGAAGEKLWSLITFGKTDAKALVGSIRLDGAPVKETDTDGWRHVAAVLANALRQREVHARWDTFAGDIGVPTGSPRNTAVAFFRSMLTVCDDARVQSDLLTSIVAKQFSFEQLCTDSELCAGLARQIQAASTAARLAAVEHERRRVRTLFDGAFDRTSILVQQLLDDVVGRNSTNPDKVATVWRSVLRRLGDLKDRARDFEEIAAFAERLRTLGAPAWAKRVLSEKAAAKDDPVIPSNWREAWDYGAADAYLKRIDKRDRLAQLSVDRAAAESRARKLFGELVRERTFYELDRRLSPSVKAALVAFVRALARIGKGTGKAAATHRHAARNAMSQCYDAVPCWIMPTWRVAEQLPAELGALDLVIIDEASQSDVTELPALLRGKKVIVVGDDRQVSPTAPFVTQEKINQLRHHHLGDLPFNSLLEPGESIYDLMRAVFPNERLMLKEHFRCVEPIIRFSMQFYPEKMLPLRIPAAHERLDPPLVDIYLPHGTRGRNRKINEAEANLIVEEIAGLTARPDMQKRTIGVISLIGAEQAEFIRGRLSDELGEEIMQRHSILCGDSATFQGTERDIVFLSMVADAAHKTALTMLRYEQRFNVAVSRARDRVVLVRSVKREELNPNDLKARLIAHFENPMPDVTVSDDELAVCDSPFERDLMSRLMERGYRVKGQVGSVGYRIDMVVEGDNGTRLAVECDGDRYHGPEQWRQDMNRQRVLERVGWRFWRCFASSFYRDTDTVVADLLETLSRMGIAPVRDGSERRPSRYTEHRTITPPSISDPQQLDELDLRQEVPSPSITGGISLGDRVILLFSEEMRRRSVRLVEGKTDLDKGQLSATSPLGQAVLGAEEGDEVEFQLEDGRRRKALIESVEKNAIAPSGLTDGNLATASA
jgi:very-short-patch-repair endonuclease